MLPLSSNPIFYLCAPNLNVTTVSPPYPRALYLNQLQIKNILKKNSRKFIPKQYNVTTIYITLGIVSNLELI